MQERLSVRGWRILANACTVLRILLVPLFMVLSAQNKGWAGAVFLLCAILDFADGHIARRHDAATGSGRHLAYTANFITFAGMFSILISRHPMLKWTLSAYCLKELAVLLCRIRHVRRTGVHVGMLWHERCAAAIVYAMGAFMLFYDARGITTFTSALMGAELLVSQMVTLILYLYYFITRRDADPDPITDMRLVDWQGLVMALLLAGSIFLFGFTKGDAFLSTVMWRPAYLFIQFASIVGITGIPAFFWGEKLPRSRFDPERFPWKSWSWEQEGTIYEKIGIQKWKTHTPDMSKIMAKAFPKQGNLRRDPDHLRRLVKETCSAEFVHWVLVAMSVVFVPLMDSCGVPAMLLYILGNLVSIVIQRYNRPRLMKIIKRTEKRRCGSC